MAFLKWKVWCPSMADLTTAPTLGFFNAEFFAPLKPASEWPSGIDKERLTTYWPSFRPSSLALNLISPTLQDNVSEATTGVKGENSIELFGNDLEVLTKTANQIKDVLATMRGITDLAVFTSLGQPTVQIDIDRARAGRYGLTPGDINWTIRAAIGGESAGELYVPNSDQHFPIVVRLAPQYRQSPEAIRDIPVGIQGDRDDANSARSNCHGRPRLFDGVHLPRAETVTCQSSLAFAIEI